MPPVKHIILDSNVIAGITLADESQAQRVRSRLAVAKSKGARFLLPATGLTELAATYRTANKFERLIQTARETCSGILSFSSEHIIRLELKETDPYRIVTGKPPLPLDDRIESALEEEQVKRSFEERPFRIDKHLLDPLDPIAGKVRKWMPTSFVEYARKYRLTAFKTFLESCKERGRIDGYPEDLESLLERAYGWRFAVLLSLANEFRRLTRTHTKGAGCLSDIRIGIEAAYSHEIWTSDEEFVACGQMANQISKRPTVVYWNPRA